MLSHRSCVTPVTDRASGSLRGQLPEGPLIIGESACVQDRAAGGVVAFEGGHRVRAGRSFRISGRIEPQAEMIGMDWHSC